MTRSLGRELLLTGAAGLAMLAIGYLLAGVSVLVGTIVFYLFAWGAASVAWAIHAGVAGRLSLGHAAYFGIGAYSAAIVQTQTSLSVWLAFPIAIVAAALVGAGIELATGRMRGIYYALATFAFAQLVWLIARAWRSFAGGTEGITIPYASHASLGALQFTTAHPYVLLAGVVAVVCLLVSCGVHHSRLGYFARALRDAEPAAAAIGLVAVPWRAATAGISAGLTAVVGVVVVQNLLFVDPDSAFAFDISTLVMLPAILGGLNMVWGGIAGAAIIIPLRQWFLTVDAAGGAVQWIAYGAVLAAIVLFVPQGLLGLAVRRRRRPGAAGDAPPEESARPVEVAR